VGARAGVAHGGGMCAVRGGGSGACHGSGGRVRGCASPELGPGGGGADSRTGGGAGGVDRGTRLAEARPPVA
jgi:hypothetical protein